MTTNKVTVVVSWCHDLTSPDADSYPLFNLVVHEGSMEVVHTPEFHDIFKSMDSLSAAAVESFHKVAEEIYERNPSGFFRDLSTLLGRNNLHVSSYTTHITHSQPSR